jgi:hypothetical protein
MEYAESENHDLYCWWGLQNADFVKLVFCGKRISTKMIL